MLDAGNAFRPAGLIAINSLNQQGWKVHPTNPQWVALEPQMAADTYYGIFRLDEEGNLSGKVQLAEEGYSAMGRRDDYSKKSPAQYWKSEFQERYPDAVIDSMSVENQQELYQPMREHFNLTLPAYAQVSGNFIYLNPAFYSSFFENPFKVERRIYPVDIPYPIKERVVFDLVLPAGYRVESLPEPTRLSLPNNGGRFQYLISQSEGKVTLNATISVSQLYFEPDEYDALRSFFGMIAEKFGEQIVLKKG